MDQYFTTPKVECDRTEDTQAEREPVEGATAICRPRDKSLAHRLKDLVEPVRPILLSVRSSLSIYLLILNCVVSCCHLLLVHQLYTCTTTVLLMLVDLLQHLQ
jgi:hypothetical protein